MPATWRLGFLLGLAFNSTFGITLDRTGSDPEEAASGGSTEYDPSPVQHAADQGEVAELQARGSSFNPGRKQKGMKKAFAKHGKTNSFDWVGGSDLQHLANENGQARKDQTAAKQPLVELAQCEGQPVYAYENFTVGTILEGSLRNGSWVPVVLLDHDHTGWRVHVANEYPGRFLDWVQPGVLRRPLQLGEADFLVDNSILQHRGHGLKYRRSKNVSDTARDYVSWDTLVVGADLGDGWVKTKAGYLPSSIEGADVLVKRERTGEVVKVVEEVPGMLHTSGPFFEDGEECEFVSTRGRWYPCLITGDGYAHNTYNIIVLSAQFPWEEGAVVPVLNVKANRLRRVTPEPPPKTPHFPAANCTRQGCQIIHVISSTHREFLMQLPVGSKFGDAMKMVCSRLKIDWEACHKRHHYVYGRGGRALHENTEVSLTDTLDTLPILMKEGPPAEAE